MASTITATIFKVESEAYQAFHELKGKADGKDCHIVQAALMKRSDEHIEMLESFDNTTDRNDKTLKGSLIGAVVGLIMGPIGILVGGGIGAALAWNKDDEDYRDTMPLIENVATRIMEGEVVIIALLDETDETVFDTFMGAFDTQTLRWDSDDIKEQVQEARDLQEDLANQAQAKLRQKKDEA